MQSAVLAIAFSLSSMGFPDCYGAGRGVWQPQAGYSSYNSNAYYGGGSGGTYVANRGGLFRGGLFRMGLFGGGYPQGGSNMAYRLMPFGRRYRVSAGQMASYYPTSPGYAMPMTSYPVYGASTMPITYGTPMPMSYGTPGTVTSGTPGTTTYSSAYGRPAAGTPDTLTPGQLAPATNIQGPSSSVQPGNTNQEMNNLLQGAGRVVNPITPSAPSAPTVPPTVPAPNP
jgi:hypothetical protein